MDYTFKPPTGSVHMPTKIPQATRETDSTISKMVTGDKRALAMKRDTDPQPSVVTRKVYRRPHIVIYPWDGSASTRQQFMNQLEAHDRFPDAEFRHDNEKMMWALSFFMGDAADATKILMRRLTSENGDRFIDDYDYKRDPERWAPTEWDEFIHIYLEMIEEKVKRKREWRILKAFRFIGAFLCFIVRCIIWFALIVALAALLIQVLGIAAENSALLWEWKKGRIVPTV